MTRRQEQLASYTTTDLINEVARRFPYDPHNGSLSNRMLHLLEDAQKQAARVEQDELPL